jgi:predicted DNA-binding transcriptional regulator AlpA
MTLQRLIGLRELCEHLGTTDHTLRRWWKAGLFPEPIRLGKRRLVWSCDVVNAWIDEQREAALEKEPSV